MTDSYCLACNNTRVIHLEAYEGQDVSWDAEDRPCFCTREDED